MKKLRVLDLFSGIGGFSLGLERTGGFETVAFCEIDPFCRRVLAKHWPDVPIYEDVRSLTGEQVGPVDVICGGFPCQDISSVGARRGIDGEHSGLWRDFARLISELRPSVAIVENVPALLERGVHRVLGDLAEIGFDAWWDCVPASALGAPHRRDRVWLVAYAAGVRREQGRRAEEKWRRLIRSRNLGSETPWSCAENNDSVRSRFLRVVDGLPNRVDRLRGLGNAVVPQIPELIGRAILEAEQRP